MSRGAAYCLAGLLVVASQSCSASAPQVHADPRPEPRQSTPAVGMLDQLAEALARGDQARAASFGADDTTRRTLKAAAANVEALGLSAVGLRHSTSSSTVVDLTWTPRPHTRALSVHLPLQVRAQQVQLTTPRADDDQRLPVWWQGRLSVARRGAIAVAVLGSPQAAHRWLTLATAARDGLTATPVRQQGPAPVWIEVVPQSSSLDQALAAAPGTYASVAAVTSAADGSREPDADVRVLVAENTMRGMVRLGQRTVLAHELVHLFSGDATRGADQVPVWWLEGRADLYALAGLPSARQQMTARLRHHLARGGDAARLPGSADFAPGSPRFEVAYELAWQACEALRDQVGDRGLVQFDEALRGGQDLNSALRSAGTSRRAFMHGFRTRLQHLTE